MKHIHDLTTVWTWGGVTYQRCKCGYAKVVLERKGKGMDRKHRGGLNRLGAFIAALGLAFNASAITINDKDVILDSGKSLQQAIIDGDIGGSGGAAVFLDINGVEMSVNVNQIDILTGDTNGVFAEDNPNELTVDPAANWPTCDIAEGLSAGAIDNLTDFNASLLSGDDSKIITGTPEDGKCGQFNADGDLVAAAEACGSGGGGAPTDATYITKTLDATLSAEQAIGALASGLMFVTTSTGDITSVVDLAGLNTAISSGLVTGAHTTDTGPSPDCSGTTVYQDGEGNCDTLDGLEDFEAATNDGIPVGTGSVFETKVVPDCDNATTSKLLYDQATNAFSCGTDQQGQPANESVGVPELDDGSTSGDDDDVVMIDENDNSQFKYVDVPDCDDTAGNHLNYDTITHAFSCGSSGGGGAPTDATYITQTADGDLSAEQALGALATGLMKVTTSTGVVSAVTDLAGLNTAISSGLVTGAHTTDTSANTVCTGTTTYMDGEGNCDDLSSVYQGADADLTDLADGELTPATVSYGTSTLKCARFDANGDLVSASADCTAGDTDTAGTFDQVGAGTNTNALLIGASGSLGTTGGGTITATAVDTDAVAQLADIATAIKSGLDAKLITGTASTGECAEFDAQGDLIGAGGACTTGGSGDSVLIDGTPLADGSGVDFIGGTDITIAFNAGASPDTATINWTGTHTTDTGPDPDCTGTTTYQDGEGECDDLSSVYQATDGDLDDLADGELTPGIVSYGTSTLKCARFDGNGDLVSASADCTAGDTDTNANTVCTGTTTYMDGEGECDDLSSVYQPLDADLTDLADGSLTGTKVGTGIAAGNVSSGVLLHEQGGLELDVKDYNGLIRIAAGSTTNVTNLAGLNTAIGSGLVTGAHTTDTSANTECSGGTTYMDGDGGCDDISTVYQAADADLTDLADGELTPATVSYGTSTLKCARFDANGDLVSASGDCTAGDTGGSGLFTDGGAVTYLTSQTDDLAIGGTDSSAAFFVDAGTGDVTVTGELTLECDNAVPGDCRFDYIDDPNCGVAPDAGTTRFCSRGGEFYKQDSADPNEVLLSTGPHEATAVEDDLIVNADINSAAAIDSDKLATDVTTRKAAHLILLDPAITDEIAFKLPPWTGTMTRIDCEAQGGTSVVINICDGEDLGDDTCTTSIPGSTMTCDTTGANDTTLTNPGFAARDELSLVITTVNGSVAALEIYITATVD